MVDGLVFLLTKVLEIFFESLHLAGIKTALYHLPLTSILVDHRAWNEGEKDRSDTPYHKKEETGYCWWRSLSASRYIYGLHDSYR